MMLLYLPKNESAMKAPTRGERNAVPDQAFTLAAAAAVDCPSGPVK